MKALVLYSILVLLALTGCKPQETRQRWDSDIIKTHIDEKGVELKSDDDHLPMFRDPFWYPRLTLRRFDKKYKVETRQIYMVLNNTD